LTAGDESAAPTVARSGALTAAAVVSYVEAALVGLVGLGAAIGVVGMVLDAVVHLVYELLNGIGLSVDPPDVLPDLSVANMDTFMFLLVAGGCLLLLARYEIRLAEGIRAGAPEEIQGAVNLQWVLLGITALFAFWTFVIAREPYVFPLVGVVLPVALLVAVGVGRRRVLPVAEDIGSSLAGSKVEKWRFADRSARKEALLALAFLAPAAVVFGYFFFYALSRLVHFAIYQQNRTGTAERYVGPSQITEVLSGSEFREGLQHTLTYVLFTVPAGLILGILLAVVANRRLRGIKFFQTVFSSTVATSVAVASVVFFVLVHPQVGYFKVDWLSEPNEVLFGVSLSSIWQNLGLTFIIVLAGLQAVPEELMESATIDGAGPVRRFFSVTLPLISPTLLFLVVVLTIFAFQAFAQIDILTNGGPAGASETLVYKIFDLQDPRDLGEGSAMALGLFGITFLVTMGQFLILDRRVHYG
jgi:sn-glycerol 3-phosphate transport system permease protein